MKSTLLAVVAALVLATTAMVAAPAATEITVGTHNSHYGDGSFERFAGVIGWQEVNDPEDRQKLDNRLGAEYATFYPADGPAKAVPISWRVDRFAKTGGGSVRTHGGEAGVTPARYVNWVILDVRGTAESVIVERAPGAAGPVEPALPGAARHGGAPAAVGFGPPRVQVVRHALTQWTAPGGPPAPTTQVSARRA